MVVVIVVVVVVIVVTVCGCCGGCCCGSFFFGGSGACGCCLSLCWLLLFIVVFVGFAVTVLLLLPLRQTFVSTLVVIQDIQVLQRFFVQNGNELHTICNFTVTTFPRFVGGRVVVPELMAPCPLTSDMMEQQKELVRRLR